MAIQLKKKTDQEKAYHGLLALLPLRSECHRGSKGVHGDKSRLRMASTSELKLLDELIGLVVAMKLENVGTEYAHTTA